MPPRHYHRLKDYMMAAIAGRAEFGNE